MSKEIVKVRTRPKLPPWIRVKISCGEGRNEVTDILKENRLNTVCQSAHCPNLAECWHHKTATFMIMGNECTRNCKFCAVNHDKKPVPLETDEPKRVADAAKKMGLKYVVVTSVTRDDLPDGGASHFAEVIRELRNAIPDVKVEVLTPDFNNDREAIKTVLDAKPTVFNHNMETVKRLAGEIRNKATYQRSLDVLKTAVELSNGTIPVKSGLMVGLGETDDEVVETIRELRSIGVEILTVGQYLPPTNEHWPLERYVEPDTFKKWEKMARELGFSFVACAPLVRSSYSAAELFEKGEVK